MGVSVFNRVDSLLVVLGVCVLDVIPEFASKN